MEISLKEICLGLGGTDVQVLRILIVEAAELTSSQGVGKPEMRVRKFGLGLKSQRCP